MSIKVTLTFSSSSVDIPKRFEGGKTFPLLLETLPSVKDPFTWIDEEGTFVGTVLYISHKYHFENGAHIIKMYIAAIKHE